MSLRLPAEQYLNQIFEKIDEDSKPLNSWENSFMKDQRERYDEYTDGTRFSARQWVVIMKIGDLFDIERVTLDEHASQ